MFLSFCWLKAREHADLSYRKDLTFSEILLMAIPSALNTLAGYLYYVLQRMIEDELTIHVLLPLFIRNHSHYSLLTQLKQSSPRSSPISSYIASIS